MKSATTGLSLAVVAIAALNGGYARAQSPADADLDVTMSVVEEGQGPAGVIQQIQLPTPASTTAVPQSEKAQDTAGEARAGASATGRSTAEAAKSAAAGVGSDAAAAARSAVSDSLSSGDAKGVPAAVKDNLPLGKVVNGNVIGHGNH